MISARDNSGGQDRLGSCIHSYHLQFGKEEKTETSKCSYQKESQHAFKYVASGTDDLV